MTSDAKRIGGISWRLAMWVIAASLLLMPLVAMHFTSEVAWDATDFVTMGIMLALACGTVELASRKSTDGAYRAAVCVAVLAAFLLIWVNLAVGVLGDEGNRANLLFLGVIAVAIIGAIDARLRPGGMARVMAVTAVAQCGVGVIALAAGWASPGAGGLYEVLIGSSMFAALWLLSAWLFRRAAQGQGERLTA